MKTDLNRKPPPPLMEAPSTTPILSIIILNYNGAQWIQRCLNSIREQTIFPQLQVIVADNLSQDGSDDIASALLETWPNGVFLQNGVNCGFCEGNNRAVPMANGKFLFFLNNDAWLEPDCLERLLGEVKSAHASAATPLVMNYDDNSFQSLGAAGFDFFGLATARRFHMETREVLMPEGCSYLIQRGLFDQLGRFDPEFFMFADELDLSWRLWVAGHRAVAVPGARLHHRGAANVNPAGRGTVVEFRTSDTKRFYANRNSLLVLLKNGQHLLLGVALLQLGLLAVEALAAMVLIRRWSFVRRAYWHAVADCWRLRGHIRSERQRLKPLRRRSDWWMLRFLRPRLNRWDELCRAVRFGTPKVTPE